MIVWSLRVSKARLAVLCAALALGIVGGFFLFRPSQGVAVAAAEHDYKARNNEERIAFLKQFGWEAAEEPREIMELVVPQEFDAAYESYNELQKRQGLDLAKFRGKRVKRYTYEVLNCRDADGATVAANLLIYDGVVIGGDISSPGAEKSFMRTFQNKE